jgi:hypothetical protein
MVDMNKPVAFLKIDCESSEWPILYTSTQLHNVFRIAGEYHIPLPEREEYFNLDRPCTIEGLREFLHEHFAIVNVQEPFGEWEDGEKHAPLGIFSASN